MLSQGLDPTSQWQKDSGLCESLILRPSQPGQCSPGCYQLSEGKSQILKTADSLSPVV